MHPGHAVISCHHPNTAEDAIPTDGWGKRGMNRQSHLLKVTHQPRAKISCAPLLQLRVLFSNLGSLSRWEKTTFFNQQKWTLTFSYFCLIFNWKKDLVFFGVNFKDAGNVRLFIYLFGTLGTASWTVMQAPSRWLLSFIGKIHIASFLAGTLCGSLGFTHLWKPFYLPDLFKLHFFLLVYTVSHSFLS